MWLWHLKKSQSSELSFLLGFERSAGIQLLCGSLLWISVDVELAADTISISDIAVISDIALKITRVLSEEKDLPRASFAADTFCAVGLPE